MPVNWFALKFKALYPTSGGTFLYWPHDAAGVQAVQRASNGQVFSSTAKVKYLVHQEAKLLEHLDMVIAVAERSGTRNLRLEKLKENLHCLKQKHSSLPKDEKSLMDTPVFAFRLIRRLSRDWKSLLMSQGFTGSKDAVLDDNLSTTRDVLSKWRLWPRDVDIEGAALGLVRLASTYDIYPRYLENNDLSNNSGNILKLFITNEPFTRQTPVLNKLFVEMEFPKTTNSIKDLLTHLPDISINECVRDSLSPNDDGSDISKCDIKTGRVDSCLYSYSVLDLNDLIYITEIAMEQSSAINAIPWFNIAISAINNSTFSIDWDTLKTVNSLRQRLLNRVDTCTADSDNNADTHDTVIQYKALCKQSIMEQHSASRSNYCQWHYVWPYLRHKQEVMSESPWVVRYHDVISEQNIEEINRVAFEKLSPSELSNNEKTRNKKHLLRVSQTAWLADDSPVISKLSKLIHDITGLDTGQYEVDTCAEPLQVVNYGLGGMYGPHEDSVRASRETGLENSPAFQKSGDRLATWMYYLSDVPAGGATVFPRLHLTVQPIKGSAVLWYNLKTDGSPDTDTVHAGCPVLVGDKWIANKWIRERCQTFQYPCAAEQ